MATPEPVEPSRRLQQAAQAERERLLRDREQVVREAHSLSSRLEEVDQRRLEIEQRLALLDQLAGPRQALTGRTTDNVITFPETPSEPLNGYLRGALIRVIAARLLAAMTGPDQPIHYTDWYALVVEAGYGVSGKDPLASFLTQVSRSPVVVRGEQPGVYLLDPTVPDRLRACLDALNEELLALHNGQQTIEAITSARERRAELVAEINRIERALEEAIDSLGEPLPRADHSA